MSEKKLNIGDQAPSITIRNHSDEDLTLDKKFWAQGSTFVTFLRHFG